jgi:hypothetical protein
MIFGIDTRPDPNAVADAVVNLSFRRKARTGRDAAMRPSRYSRTLLCLISGSQSQGANFN